jgi:hypothetical protein
MPLFFRNQEYALVIYKVFVRKILAYHPSEPFHAKFSLDPYLNDM